MVTKVLSDICRVDNICVSVNSSTMLREPGEESYSGSEPTEGAPIAAQQVNSDATESPTLDERPNLELKAILEPCEEAEECVEKPTDGSKVETAPRQDLEELDRLELKQKIMEIVSNLPLKPPMNHSDTKDSLSSVDSFQLKEEDAHHADLSDSASDDMNRKKPEGVKIEEEETEFVPPDDELAQKIIDQVEFYFSDVNITKDAFLLKHVKRNKEGYVSLKLISSFKRVKHLAKDWRVVAYALAKSKKLEINEVGTKLRRVDPLPAYDQTTPSRTVVAIDLPLEKPTIENVAEMFKSCGEIALIRILRPGNPIPADVRHFVNKHPEMIGKISALVEFVRTESAHNAIQKEWSWRTDENMKVIELNAPPSVDKKKKTKKMMRAFDMEYSSSCQSGSEAEDRRMRLTRRCSSPQLSHGDHWMQRRWSRDSGTDSSSSYSRSRSNSGVYYMPDVRRMSTDSCSDSHSSRSRSNSGISLSDIRRLSIISKDSDCCCCHADCSRRGSSGSEGYGSSRSRCNSGASDIRRNSIEFYCAGKGRERRYPEQSHYDNRRHDNKPRSNGDNVVRMPRGPDGGRGFIPTTQPCHTLIE
ncbi:hypothetical protein GE061_001747 [Apolygus lucorum]|uniref:HTH La-type RNA-binding domain-containing protein n=1 Tax=Apolygus lucorum TaxID=248454 RepID=A0A8S9Y7Y7_APOLU|nr:hypothetical protein GE061_001747 [Apolygus lucorum]